MHRKALTHRPIDPEIQQLVNDHEGNPEAVLEILGSLQQLRGELTTDAITDVARTLGIPDAKAFGIATFYSLLSTPPFTIRVCDAPACWLKGSAYARAALQSQLDSRPDNGAEGVQISRSSCLGLCDRAPAALFGLEQTGPLEPAHLEDLFSGWRGEMPDYSQPLPGEIRNLLAHAGQIDPDSIESALRFGAYLGLEKALHLSPEAVIQEIERSGLRGRGGAGFPTGRKLRFVAQAAGMEKYIVCNADESEPLVFKDRVMIDTNPHKILEGMALAAYAVGAKEGFIYIRGEYKAQADRLERAVRQAEEYGWLGENIKESGFSFHLNIHRGAGAYICGEETALLESLEGKRGEPRIRPPFPATFGYHGCPTVVNNIETFASHSAIVLNGSEWYLSTGSKETPGTKLYTILGHVRRPGLFEAPYGLTLREIIEEFGGGMSPDSIFHFALTGGAAGTIVPPALLDHPIDYGSAAKGVSLGAGAFLICDQTVSPLFLLREVMHFFEMESCGKCTPCRTGTHESRQILDRIIANKSGPGAFDSLAEIAQILQAASFCGLGQSAAIPIQTALKHFPKAFRN
jgi:NADH:ubiquinone oxidoreductase subunit F (NADH-binding)/NADH:ubiquinone oxidoreductase subunit E